MTQKETVMIWSLPIWFHEDGNYALLATLDGLIPLTVTERREVVFTLTHLKLLQILGTSAPQLMPRIMTMNGDHQSVAAAPLDLRTTNRERGSAGSRSPDCKGRVRDAGVTGGSPAHPACTGTDSLEIHCPGSETGTSRKRPADKSSFRLPFRKRPIHVEPETQRQSPNPPHSGDRFSPAVDTDSTFREGFAGRPSTDSRTGTTPVTPRRDEQSVQRPDGYPIFLHHFGKRFPTPIC